MSGRPRRFCGVTVRRSLVVGVGYRPALEAAERALADAERLIVGNGGQTAWAGSLVLEGVRICLRNGRWPDVRECALAFQTRRERGGKP